MGDNGSDGNDSLTVRDNRTGREYEIDIQDGDVINAMDLRQIKVNDDDFGMMSYDPAFSNTASTRSSITFIDGGKGILQYRGYPIEQLADRSSFLEVAYLILKGELPTQAELDGFVQNITHHTYVHENFRRLMHGFRYDAHAMSMVISGVAALNTFYPDGNDVRDADNRWLQIQRLVAKMPTLAAYAYRHHRGLPAVYPGNELSYTANFLNMLFRIGGREYTPNPVLERALDVLFILHADHEQNCSATTMRVIGSAEADPYSSLAGAMGALFGPLHGGANEAVLRMLKRIGSMDNIPAFMEGVKHRKERLMGFGHRVYKAYDPRASIIKRTADEVFEVTGRNPLLDIALELEKIALEDDFFVSRNLYPNVDFYSGSSTSLWDSRGDVPVLFAIPRTAGWLAQWEEMLEDKEQRIARPRQIFTGSAKRDFVAIEDREFAALTVRPGG